MRIGIYYTVMSEADHAKRLADFRKIKATGCNAIATYLLPSDLAFCQRCQANGIELFAERAQSDNTLANLDKIMAALGSYISGIITFDDVDSPKKNLDPLVVGTLNRKVKEKYPDKLVYTSGGYIARWGRYAGLGEDLMLCQGYPVGNGTENVYSAWDYWKAMPAKAAPVMQTFAWQGQRKPTPAEIRSMTFQALALPVKTTEVWYYAFYDGGANDMGKSLLERQQLRNVTREVKYQDRFR